MGESFRSLHADQGRIDQHGQEPRLGRQSRKGKFIFRRQNFVGSGGVHTARFELAP